MPKDFSNRTGHDRLLSKSNHFRILVSRHPTIDYVLPERADTEDDGDVGLQTWPVGARSPDRATLARREISLFVIRQVRKVADGTTWHSTHCAEYCAAFPESAAALRE